MVVTNNNSAAVSTINRKIARECSAHGARSSAINAARAAPIIVNAPTRTTATTVIVKASVARAAIAGSAINAASSAAMIVNGDTATGSIVADVTSDSHPSAVMPKVISAIGLTRQARISHHRATIPALHRRTPVITQAMATVISKANQLIALATMAGASSNGVHARHRPCGVSSAAGKRSMASMSTLEGSCYCANISYQLSWPEPEAIVARACSCDFCQKHGAAWTSHPQAKLEVRIINPERTLEYRFGHRTATFYICAECGVVPVASCQFDDALVAVTNVNTFATLDGQSLPVTKTDFSAEDIDLRLARRARNWTPLTLR